MVHRRFRRTRATGWRVDRRSLWYLDVHISALDPVLMLLFRFDQLLGAYNIRYPKSNASLVLSTLSRLDFECCKR